MQTSACFQTILSRNGNRLQPADQMRHIINRDCARTQKFLNEIQPHGPLVVHELRNKRGHDKPTPGSQQDTSMDVTDSVVTYVMPTLENPP
ncbi:hypothetical protein PM082_017083 [Marasmius tenuissimus]|nr:hypothetical protein PM082_017083 [Marasmius tenuissimus]